VVHEDLPNEGNGEKACDEPASSDITTNNALEKERGAMVDRKEYVIVKKHGEQNRRFGFHVALTARD
jgi:hypothetical protein